MIADLNEKVIDATSTSYKGIDYTYSALYQNINNTNYCAILIKIESTIKLSNYHLLFDIESKIIDELKEVMDKKGLKDITITAVFEFAKRVRFLPDIRSLHVALDKRSEMMKKLDIKFKQLIAVTTEPNKPSRFDEVLKNLLKNVHIHLFSDTESALEYWNKIIRE